MTLSDPVKQAWQAWQASAAGARDPSLDDVREGADRFYRMIRRRNRREYVLAGLAILFCGAIPFLLEGVTARIGAALVVFGILIMVWQLHRRASAVPPPEEPARALIDHQRAQLVRQCDALASAPTWYLLPVAPGVVLITLNRAIEKGVGALEWFDWFWIGCMVLALARIWWVNRAAARQLQAEIDALDALGEDR